MRKFFLLLTGVSITITFFLTGCFKIPENVLLPEWDVNLNIPVINDYYTLNDIIKKQKYIKIDKSNGADSIYILESDAFFANTKVTDFLKESTEASSDNNPVFTSNEDTSEIYLSFPEGSEIKKAEFQSGNFRFNVTNPSGSNIDLTIIIPGVHKPNGNSIEFHYTIPAGGSITQNYELKNHSYFRPDNQPDSLNDKIRIQAKAVSENNSNAVVFVDLYVSDLYFDFAEGKLPPKSLGVKRTSYKFASNNNIDFGDSCVLREAKFLLEANYFSSLSNSFPIEMKNLKIIGKKNDGRTFLLKDSTGSNQFNLTLKNGKCEKLFNEKNSNVTSFIAFLPDSVVFISEYIMNPGFVFGSITSQDSVNVQSDFATKSYFALKKSNIYDTTEVKLSDKDREKLLNGVSGDVNIELQNAVPLTCWLKIVLADQNYKPLFTLTSNDQDSDSLYFLGAETNANGEVIQPYQNPPVLINLDSTKILELSKAYYAFYSISMRTKEAYNDPPPIVVVRPSDWFKVKVYSKVNYKVN